MQAVVQGFVLDLLRSVGLRDDGFAGQFAQVYVARRRLLDSSAFRAEVSAIATGILPRRRRDREALLDEIVRRVDARFQRRLPTAEIPKHFEPPAAAGVRTARARAASRNDGAAFGKLIDDFAQTIRSKATDSFWESRSAHKPRRRPEVVAEVLLTVFLDRPVRKARGAVYRQPRSGIGYIDLMVHFPNARYIVELKVLQKGRLAGIRQLAEYLELEGLAEGWLVVMDMRDPKQRTPVETGVATCDGRKIHIVAVDVNPLAPSSLG